ncbi:MAG TPA: hypothetical protein DEZ08_05965 [Dehalococcoidia bacterium]|mgnify:CR=1 FL=1|nr:hypothetical protein [Dehalococcoidia bacterium]|tara:strand:+ start:1285 stop:1677 length:393 start_codon:yes stop_codon:yes gene_type:complete
MQELNVAYIQRLIDKRNLVSNTILLFVTCGFFWVYWLYLIASDLNRLNGIEWEKSQWIFMLSNPLGWILLMAHVVNCWHLLTGVSKFKMGLIVLAFGGGILSVIRIQYLLNRIWEGNQTYYWPPDFSDTK